MKEWTVRNLECLDLMLPDEIAKYKMIGDYPSAAKAIARWMERPVSQKLKERLELEAYFLNRLPVQFPYTAEQLVETLKADLPEFSLEELEELDEAGLAEWMMIDGCKHYVVNASDNILRLKENNNQNIQILEETIHQMKADGHAYRKLKIRASVALRDEVFQPGMKVKVHIPIPALGHQIIATRILDHSPSMKSIDKESSLFRAICFEETMTENHEYYVVYEYETDITYVDLYQEAENCIKSDSCKERSYPADLEQYTKEELPHIRFSHDLRALAEEITAGMKDPLVMARAIYDYVTCNVKYSYMCEYFLLEDIPQYCARNLRGDCGVQALLFITLCRICGIPAKWQSGLYAAPYYIGNHDWALFYVEPYGWRYADNSFGGSAYRAGAEERRQFYFGNLDPYRMVANNAFMQDYSDPKKHLPADPYDNQSGEIESEERGYTSEEMIVTHV